MVQHVCGFANMLDILGFLIHVFERYSIYFVFDELLLNFSRLMSLTLQKCWVCIPFALFLFLGLILLGLILYIISIYNKT